MRVGLVFGLLVVNALSEPMYRNIKKPVLNARIEPGYLVIEYGFNFYVALERIGHVRLLIRDGHVEDDEEELGVQRDIKGTFFVPLIASDNPRTVFLRVMGTSLDDLVHPVYSDVVEVPLTASINWSAPVSSGLGVHVPPFDPPGHADVSICLFVQPDWDSPSAASADRAVGEFESTFLVSISEFPVLLLVDPSSNVDQFSHYVLELERIDKLKHARRLVGGGFAINLHRCLQHATTELVLLLDQNQSFQSDRHNLDVLATALARLRPDVSSIHFSTPEGCTGQERQIAGARLQLRSDCSDTVQLLDRKAAYSKALIVLPDAEAIGRAHVFRRWFGHGNNSCAVLCPSAS